MNRTIEALNRILDISIFDIGKVILFLAFVLVSALVMVRLLGNA